MEHWREATAGAEAMLAAIKGDLDEDDRRDVLAEVLHRRGADPVLVKAVSQPEAEAPPVTLQDAKRMYFTERVEGEKGRNKRDQLERVCKRIEAALGPLGKLPLVGLEREHARRLRDFLLKETKKEGAPLAAGSLQRERNMLVAMVNLAIVEFDLEGKALNLNQTGFSGEQKARKVSHDQRKPREPTLRDWVNRQAVEDGARDGLTQSERDELKALQRENRELKQANEILRKGEAFVRH